MPETAMIHKAMLAVMRNIKEISKDQKNQHFRYNFRGIDQVYNVLHPLLKKNGIYQRPEVVEHHIQRDGKTVTAVLIVDYHFVAEDGSSVNTRVIGMGADTGDKATNKALSGAHKYALLQTFVIPCDGMDEQDASDFQYESKAQPPLDQGYTINDKAWLWSEMVKNRMSDEDGQEFAKKLHEEAAWKSLKKSEVLEKIREEYDRRRTLAQMEKQGVTS